MLHAAVREAVPFCRRSPAPLRGALRARTVGPPLLSAAVLAALLLGLAAPAAAQNEHLPSLAIDDVTVTEGVGGTTTATFTVTLSPTAPFPVSVAFATADGSAVAGSDYTATAGTLNFDPQATSLTDD